MSENRLGRETSPYLLQHKDNPVHWWAWGPEALAEAKRSGKPILLSVGYAACHWCHVMAHESFEDEATAAVMNELFVPIKVDREERPDIDAIYMGALHALGEQGGWPLTMFLDPDARPVWGGTYFPKETRFGRPAFVDVLGRVAQVFREEPEKVANNARLLTEGLAAPANGTAIATIDDRLLRDLTTRMAPAVDPIHGGIRGAPKFPQWSFFWMLWRGGIRYDVAAGARGGRHHAEAHLSGRHLRSPRRRLRALLRRRGVARPALREDALRQRAAARSLDRGVARDAESRCLRRASPRRSAGSSAR